MNVEGFKPSGKKLILFVLIASGIEFILWVMSIACAFSCPPPPSPCRPRCLLNPEEFLPATVLNLVFSYILSCIIKPEEKSTSEIFFILIILLCVAAVIGFFIYPIIHEAVINLS